jgi:hypothetical protein
MRAILACLLLAGCATGNVTLNAERGAMLARASHAISCETVEANRAVMGPEKFGRARDLCIRADDILDSADAAVIIGNSPEAAARVNEAIALIEAIKALGI